MGLPDLWADAHVTTMHITVAYSHDRQGWRAGYTLRHQSDDDDPRTLGNATIEFGPFDSSTEVGYWLAALTKVLRTMQTDKTLPIAP